jgi:hypothetical protein
MSKQAREETAPRCLLGALAVLIVACSQSPAPAPAIAEPRVEPAPSNPEPAVEDEQLPVPQAVSKLHRSAFEPSAAEKQLGGVVCLVTLHDAALRRGEFYPLVVFAGGSVGTWRQTPTGAEEPLQAKLHPEEQVRASELIEAIPRGRATARRKFDAAALVMGVSTRRGERVETLYFDHARIPDELGQLVAMLKQRLEATHRRP